MSPFARGSDDTPAGAQHDDSPAKVHLLASRRLGKLDEAKAHNLEDEVAPSPTHSRCNRKRTLRGEVSSSSAGVGGWLLCCLNAVVCAEERYRVLD